MWSTDFKQNIRKLLREPAFRAFALIYLVAFVIQLFHKTEMAVSSLFIVLVTFALILLALRATEGMEVEVVLIRKPVILGVGGGFLIIVLWMLTLPGYRLIPEVSENWMVNHHIVRFSDDRYSSAHFMVEGRFV